jgi:hypothetical protein
LLYAPAGQARLASVKRSASNPRSNANPYTLPLPADARLAIVEGDLLLFRLVDLAPLGWHDDVGRGHTSVEIFRRDGRPHLRAQHAGRTLELSDRFIDRILLDFRTVADTLAQINATAPR